MGFSEPNEILHANGGDDDDKRYLNVKVFSKACRWLCMGIFVEHKLMCFVCFIFRKDIFTRKKIEQEEQKDQKRGKSIELKQTEQR